MTYSHVVKGNWSTVVKTSAGYNWRGTRPNSNYNSGSNFVRTVKDHPLKNMEDKGIFDSGCSGHMTGNMDHLCIVKNLVYHSKTKHIVIRHHFIRDSYEKKLIRVEKIHTYFNVADLLTKAFDGPRFNFLVVLIGDFVTPTKPLGEAQEEEISPTTLEA
ncbi:hypothetical protein Tco_1039864, partial [Tanacetum coccineum]